MNGNEYIFSWFNEIGIETQNWMMIRWIQITIKDEKELVMNGGEYIFSQFSEILLTHKVG